LGWAEAELSVTLLGDRAMARLNRETFGRRGPTNVMAFPVDLGEGPGAEGPCPSPKSPPQPPYKGFGGMAGEPGFPGHPRKLATAPHAAPPMMLGEVVISVATTRRQAKEFGWPWRQLLDFFLIHGILHLLGFEHTDPAGEAGMTERTWELMALLHPRVRREE